MDFTAILKLLQNMLASNTSNILTNNLAQIFSQNPQANQNVSVQQTVQKEILQMYPSSDINGKPLVTTSTQTQENTTNGVGNILNLINNFSSNSPKNSANILNNFLNTMSANNTKNIKQNTTSLSKLKSVDEVEIEEKE